MEYVGCSESADAAAYDRDALLHRIGTETGACAARRPIALLGQVGEGAGEGGRLVERLGAFYTQTKALAEITKCYVDVVEDFDVIAKESDGLDDDGGVSCLTQRREGVLDRGPYPRAAGDALALKGEEPISIGQTFAA